MLDKNITEYVAKLARIGINEEEKEYLGNQLKKIIEYIDKLKEVEITNIEPLRGTYFKNNFFRKDEVRKIFSPEEILNNAPQKENNFFKIPKVIE